MDQQGCQETPANSSTLYPNVEDYKGPTGLSPPAAYLNKPWDIWQMKVTLSLDTTSMLLITTAVRLRLNSRSKL
jgi:hypothetical protein